MKRLFIILVLLSACRQGVAETAVRELPVEPRATNVAAEVDEMETDVISTATLAPTIIPTPTATPEPTLEPIVFADLNFVFQDTNPVVSHVLSDDFAELYINPGAVLVHDNQFHMFFNSFTSWPGVIKVGYQTSSDGRIWVLEQETAVFTTDRIPYASDADVSSVVVREDGTWLMYFHTIIKGEIGVATAPGPKGPWQVEPEPLLRRGANDAWDGRGLAWPSVVYQDGIYHMYYGAKSKTNRAIGLAISTDGLNWTKYDDPSTVETPFQESDPVLVASQAWDLKSVDRPSVQYTPDGWVMLFAGGGRNEQGLALSADGVHWEVFSGNPILTPATFPVNNGKTWDNALLFHNGTYHYFMEIGLLNGTDLYLATHDGSLQQ